MERSHAVVHLVWAAYLVATQTPGMSAVQFQRQLGLSRYETAFQILHNSAPEWSARTKIVSVGRANEHVEVDETWVGGRTRGEGERSPQVLSPALLRRAIGSLEPRRTSERMGAMQGAFGWRSPLTEAPDRFVNLLMAPLLRGR